MNKIFALLLLFVSACSHSYGNVQIANVIQVQKDISGNISTPEELIQRYGEPQQIFTKDGQQVYEYRYISVSGIPDEEYSTGAQHYDIRYIYVYFDNQILTRVENIARRGAFPPENVFEPFLKK
ncbi:MAG: hypothetical protein IJZ59_06425 [Alphaproteobacteria bacterium]|nr:hypothetical protein [Alphaproteobacteria bacterium]